MDSRSTAPWEQQHRAPIRARGAKDGGGASGPSTVEGKIEMVKIFLEMKCFSLPPHTGPGGALKGASPGLGGGAESFFSGVLCWQNVKMCECLLATPNFQCIGDGSVPPPNALPDAGPGNAPNGVSPGLAAGANVKFFVPYRVGKMLKSVSVFGNEWFSMHRGRKCPAPTE